MITIPFYYHDGFSDSELFEELFKALYEPRVKVETLPCLCSSALKLSESPVALFHGERGEKSDCYLAARKIITENPQTAFYVVRINALTNDTGSDYLLADEFRPTNCKEITASGLGRMVDEIAKLAKIGTRA